MTSAFDDDFGDLNTSAFNVPKLAKSSSFKRTKPASQNTSSVCVRTEPLDYDFMSILNLNSHSFSLLGVATYTS